ncbi:hypothetical protein Q6303_28045, partial [Klebsiella variicola]
MALYHAVNTGGYVLLDDAAARQQLTIIRGANRPDRIDQDVRAAPSIKPLYIHGYAVDGPSPIV